MTRMLSCSWYPLLMMSTVFSFLALLSVGVSPLVAAYLPVVIAGVMIVTLEQYFPEHLDWRPRLEDVKTDMAFMGMIQIVLPRVMTPVAVILLAGWAHGTLRNSLWPHEWPVFVQIILMVLLVDFMRYWLHRACHHYQPLWRLHEVHHSPEILYILNVARFHPLEKVLHFLFDSMPFLLLGVAPEVLAGYFLLYSVNGFFQHSNLRLHYGWLNYVMASAETHRWHHALDPKTAACNFSNTTIVWDLVFGTWLLPGKMPAKGIGIMDRDYPKGFWAQLLVPFRRRNGAPT